MITNCTHFEMFYYAAQAQIYFLRLFQFKDRIAFLEKNLEEERKKAEDLQFSIDEATYCGDESSVIPLFSTTRKLFTTKSIKLFSVQFFSYKFKHSKIELLNWKKNWPQWVPKKHKLPSKVNKNKMQISCDFLNNEQNNPSKC